MLFEIDAASNPCPPRGMETGRLLPMSSARCGSRSRRGSGSRWCAYGERGSWAAHTSTDTAFRPTRHTCRTRPGSGPRSAYAARCSPSPGPSVRPKRLRCRAPRPCRARRSHRPKPAFRKVIMDGDRRSDGRYLEISASACPEGATLDWGWPPTYGSGPFALATPCTHVPGRYSGPSNFKSRVAHPWSRDIGSSTSAAQTSLNMVLSRRKARPFGLSTKLGLQENGRPSPKGTARWPGPCSMGWGTTGSASSQRSE